MTDPASRNRLAGLAVAVVATAAALACAAQPAPEPGPEPATWQLTLSADHHVDALPLAALGADRWHALAPRRGRNLAYQDDELRLQRRQGDWTVALLARSQATLVASADALALAADMATGRRPATDTRWDVQLRLRGFAGAGLALGRAFHPAPGWTLETSVQALQLGAWHERRFDGPVAYRAGSGQYAFALQSSERNNGLAFPFQQPQAQRGQALLLGAALRWQAGPLWAEAEARDGGWLRWRGMPQQALTLNTSTQTTDSEGFLVYRPLVEGQNSQVNTGAWWPWRTRLAGGVQWANGQRLGLQVDTLPGWGALPTLLWQQPAAQPGGLGLSTIWQVHERRLGVQLDWRGWHLRAAADRLDGQARSQAVTVGYSMQTGR